MSNHELPLDAQGQRDYDAALAREDLIPTPVFSKLGGEAIMRQTEINGLNELLLAPCREQKDRQPALP